MPSKAAEAGDIFAVPIEDGRFAAVRVLRTSVDESGSFALVAVTPWLGHHIPDVNEPKLRDIVRRHRGFFGGSRAICWYEGSPPGDFVYVGNIRPTDEELALDDQGAYGGHWSAAMGREVILESESAASAGLDECPPGDAPEPGADRVTGTMSEAEFWHVIQLLNWEAPDEARIVEPALQYLAQLPRERIAGFHRVLCEKLFVLDRENFAREIGDYAFGSREGFSEDHFLDVRCAVVASGPEFLSSVLSDPSKIPKDREFEPLLTLAEQAYRRRTGRSPLFVGVMPVETFSNAEGWTSGRL